MSNVLNVIALCAVAVSVGWGAKDYQFDHKPMANAMWADFEFRKCREDVKEAQLAICKSLNIDEDNCPLDFSQCDKYKEVE